ncbi:hypothetical protein BKA69DRAFT_1094612 [Paraphysoderma sedebokerense]|nr:hypothetical protein BKA69DRAFT_1094612 [Paraphysoderma sedebokerense]
MSQFIAYIGFDLAPTSTELPRNVTYTLRSDARMVPALETFIDDQHLCRNTNPQQDSQCPAMGYVTSGYTYLQHAINNAIMAESLGLANVSVQLDVQKMPKAAVSGSTDTYFKSVAPLFIVVSFIPLIQFLLVTIVTEKESRMKEGMRMQGMTLTAYWASWFVTYGILILVISLSASVISTVFGMFPRSNFILIWTIFCLFGLSIVGFSFMLTPFFNDPKLAGVVGTFSVSLASFIPVVLSFVGSAASSSVVWALSLFSPVALSLGVSNILILEDRGVGATFDTLIISDNASSYTLLSSVIMLAVDVVLYMFLAWYFDAVVPSPHGASRPWYFMFTSIPCLRKRNYARLQHDNAYTTYVSLDINNMNADNEPVSEETETKLAIDIKGLRKTFGSKVALDGVSLKMYEGSIFGLLGHNGAGKSTLVSILTGIAKPSSGDIKIYGQEVSTNVESIRSNLGVVLQKDVLWNHLTVLEHMTFYGRVKGLSESEIQQRSYDLLTELDLAKERDTMAEGLSGGQKRKLSVAIAMIGNPKVLILDEPTSGVDAYSRRKLWDIFIKYKENRVILLTTHSMDEADILASRKAILSHGKVRCVGSSLFLKNRFGVGYHLNMSKHRECDVSAVTSFVKRYIPGAQESRNVGIELSFTLPYQSVPTFKEFFEALDNGMDCLGIDSYGISMTTLEEVFLKLENEDPSKNELHQKPDPVELNYPQNTSAVFLRQLWSIVCLRCRQKIIDLNEIIAIVVLPVITLLLGFMLNQSTAGSQMLTTQIPLRYDVLPNKFFINSVPYNSSVAEPDAVNFVSKFGAPPRLVAGNLNTYFKTNQPHHFGVELAGLQPTGPAPSFNFSILFNDTSIHSLPVATSVLSNAVFSYLAETQQRPNPASYGINTINKPLPRQTPRINNSFASVLIVGISVALAPSVFGVNIVKEGANKIRHQLLIMGTRPTSYWLGCLISDVLCYSVLSIAVIIFVHVFKVEALTGNALVFFIIVLIIYMPTACLHIYCFTFKFKTVKDVQTWLPAIIYITVFVSFIVITIMDTLSASNSAKVIHYIAILLLPTYSFVGFLYYFNRLYILSDGLVTFEALLAPENTISLSILLLIVSGFLQGSLLLYLERRYGMENSQHRVQCWPGDTRKRLMEEYEVKEDKDVYFERKRIGDCVERVKREGWGGGNEKNENDILLAEGLRKEFTVEKEDKNGRRICWRRKKVKSEKVVVKDLTIGVRRGECLGLLGPNGAGKSTSQNIITGQLAPTYAGGLFIKGRSLFSDPVKSYQIMGFCPQSDALWDLLTVYEHLKFYANIKLVKKECVEELVNKMIDLLKIQEYRHVKAKDLSGGNKRKLSFAISIIGNPELLVLDECSSGMDPSSRRFMWNVVSSTAKNRACILTTHALEEADFLCTRIAIITNGELVALGSSQQLKSRHGKDTYQLEVKIRTDYKSSENSPEGNQHGQPLDERLNRVEKFVKSFLAGHSVHRIDVEGEAGGRLLFKISKNESGTETSDNGELKIGHVFGEMEMMKKELEIEEYAFMGVTLEQVFLEFARQQAVDEEAK